MSPPSDAGSVWLTGDVAIPQELLDAQQAKKLVIFVGAGASVAPPSDLPLFETLTRDLADLARVPFKTDVALDFFLGSMPADFALHAHARDLIARADSQPNSTHHAIVRLADACGPVRVVTTNFDDHLMSAARAEGIEVEDQWFGPAVPLGHDFTGLVHLHGTVLRNPSELVLTDADFGRAYVTNAWAARFLLAMFREFTVLFVGYSHDDPIMRYLALGLPSATPRFVLINSSMADDDKWERLGVVTIGYPVDNHDHSALLAALESWDVLARMGQFEHRARMKQIVDAGPTLTPVDRDYLNTRIVTAEGAKEFALSVADIDRSLRLEWLLWAETLPEFRSLFAGAVDLEEAALILGDWFCRDFLADPELTGAALQTVQRLGQRFSPRLFEMAKWVLGTLESGDDAAAQRLRVLLVTSIHGESAPIDPSGVLAYEPRSVAEHVSVVRAVLRPYLKLKQRWFLDEEKRPTMFPDAEVTWNADEATLTLHVQKAVEAAPANDLHLRGILESSVNAAYELIDGYHGNRGWDGLSFGRSAIEPHAQDQYRNPVDALIDGLRTFGEKALPVFPDLVEDWWASERTLLRRIALYLLALDGSRTADDKLEWLLDHDILFDVDYKHEAFQVLRQAVPSASEDPRRRLLADALAGPDLPEDMEDRERHATYSTYNLLVWLNESDSTWVDAETALGEIQAANPEFGPRENPDFDRWMSSGTWGGKLPIGPEEFARAWDAGRVDAVKELLDRDYSEHAFDQPSWDDCLSLIKQVVESRPDIGAPLWDLLNELDVEDVKASDIRRAIVAGWSSADLAESAESAIAKIETLVVVPGTGDTIGRFLLEQIRKLIESNETAQLSQMRDIAKRLWRDRQGDFVSDGDSDPLSFAPLYLNSWPGHLAQYWMGEIDRRWRNNRDSWSGLASVERAEVVSLLTDSSEAVPATVPALAGQLFFLFSADPAFAVRHLFPLFQERETAVLAWNPYLHHPRVNNKLLVSGFTEIIIAEWDHLTELGQDEQLRRQFFGLVAWVASFADVTELQRTALVEGSVLAYGGRYASDFASAVTDLVAEESVDGAEIFDRWLASHLSARVNGIPRTARDGELTCWADVVPFLGERFPDGLEILGTVASIGLGTHYLPEVPVETIRAFGPQLVNHYAARVRNTTPSGYTIGHRVRGILTRLRDELGDTAVQPLTDAAAEKGFLAAGFD